MSMLQRILQLNGAKAIDKSTQQTIIGRGGQFCCEWCSDGTCNGWVDSPKTTCPFAPPCNS